MKKPNTDYFNDKPYDMTTKFMGSLNDDESKPWYLKNK